MRLVTAVVLAIVAAVSATTMGQASVIQNGVEVDAAAPILWHAPTRPQLPALAIAINFDDVSAPCVFEQTTALRNQYAGLGVVFSGPGAKDGGAILDECGNFSVVGQSSPNFVAFNNTALMQDGGIPVGPERMDFSEDVSSVQVAVAGPQGGVATLSAFSAANVLLATDAINVSNSMQGLVVNAPGIRYVVLGVQGAGIWVFDDLSFETMPTASRAATWARVKGLYH